MYNLSFDMLKTKSSYLNGSLISIFAKLSLAPLLFDLHLHFAAYKLDSAVHAPLCIQPS